MSMSTAINVFLKAVAREHRSPLELSAEPLKGNLSGFGIGYDEKVE
ncbi:hypothetical protein OCV51_03980 [Faecalicatena acetigenes]|uniref:Uncharacterized protein n=1 Tax=Faecalicatena acetigenes TaxID=2981790 RepID=A0ABT2TA22_9FIRM|nr:MULTISPECIES: hypothetical protein [Lachnospiraceae]MCU6746826.1 hypothetical protein [Faecalicatena acetigenes]